MDLYGEEGVVLPRVGGLTDQGLRMLEIANKCQECLSET